MDLPLMSQALDTALLGLALDTLNGWGTILMVAVGLGMVIFIHELGHFAVAKLCGVKCEKFYLGFDIFGLKICKFQWGETEYGIGILPLGGYVKMLGQDDNPAAAAAEMERAKLAAGTTGSPQPEAARPVYDPRSYLAKSVPQRMAIISAGVIMNIIFAIFCASVAYKRGVPFNPTEINASFAGGPAWQAGLQAGDRILRIDDIHNPRSDHDFMTRMAMANLTTGVELEIQRPGLKDPFTMRLTPQRKGESLRPTVGVSPTAISTTVVDLPADKPAELIAPFQSGDTIIAVDGQPIATHYELESYLAQRPDKTIELTVQRKLPLPEGKTLAQGETAATEEANVTLPPRPMRELGLTMTTGPIDAIQSGSPAEVAGLRVGDQITQVDGQDVGDALTLAERMRQRAGETVKLTVLSAGKSEPREVDVTLRPGVGYQPQIIAGPVDVPTMGLALKVTAKIATIDPDGPAAKAGLTVGTQLKSVQFLPPEDKKDVKTQDPLPLVDAEGADNASWPSIHYNLQVLDKGWQVKIETADNKPVTLSPTLSKAWYYPPRDIALEHEEQIRLAETWGEAFSLGLRETKEASLQVYSFIRKLGEGQVSMKLMGGPGTIAQAATSQAERGLERFLIFLTLISANLAVVNFLPIPLLDGGHMVFLAAEGLRGKPVSERIVVICHYIGFAFVVSLMLFVISMDVLRGFGMMTAH